MVNERFLVGTECLTVTSMSSEEKIKTGLKLLYNGEYIIPLEPYPNPGTKKASKLAQFKRKTRRLMCKKYRKFRMLHRKENIHVT